MMLAKDILSEAIRLTSQDREETHGPKARNHANIAVMWNAYLSIRQNPMDELTGSDVALMMALLKIARTQLGAFNPDDFIDASAYVAIAGEIEL